MILLEHNKPDFNLLLESSGLKKSFFNGSHFWPLTTQVWLLFLRPFCFFESSPQFFFFFFWSHRDCFKSHRISFHSDEMVIFKISKLFFGLKWPKNSRGLKSAWSRSCDSLFPVLWRISDWKQLLILSIRNWLDCWIVVVEWGRTKNYVKIM